MGHEIVYCFKCQRRIVGQEFAQGAAYQIGHHVTCAACAVHLLETLGPKEKEQLLAQMFKTTQERQQHGSSASRPALSSSSTRLRAPAKRKTTSHIPVVRPPRGGPAPQALGVVASAVGGAVLVGLVVIALSRPKPAPAPPPPVVRPAPAPDTRREPAEAALRQARELARVRPKDHAAQVAAWELAVAAAERTPLYEEARRELGQLVLRRKEDVARELAELDAKVRALAKAEEFKAAAVLLDDARSRREGPDWTPAVDAKSRGLRETAGTLYRTARAEARAPDEIRAFRERVQRWGFADLVADLATLPPPPEERPWRSLIAKGLNSLRGSAPLGWTSEGGALIKDPAVDNSAQTREEVGDGELRVRFRIAAGAGRVWFAVRQGLGEDPHEVSFDGQALQQLGAGVHEVLITCRGDAVTAVVDGRPAPVRPGKARRGLIQFNANPGADFRVLALDLRPLP